MNTTLLILGAGQYGSIVKEVAESMLCFSKIDFLDDQNPIAIGKTSELDQFSKQYTHAFVAIGNSKIRLQLLKKLKESGYQLPILISPRAYVSLTATLSEGTVVEPMAVIQANAMIGVGCLICSGAIVKHNASVGDGCYVDCNATVMSPSVVPTETKIQANSVY